MQQELQSACDLAYVVHHAFNMPGTQLTDEPRTCGDRFAEDARAHSAIIKTDWRIVENGRPSIIKTLRDVYM
jgi:hypothetical protein